ncbi:hypothetical protein GCM10010166_35200 [Couchioplanes caeruleus subsp. azureus]|nr:hypothetical protein GCM10010166_35200 [Couchioplanes caeruleus subsp. azureus]
MPAAARACAAVRGARGATVAAAVGPAVVLSVTMALLDAVPLLLVAGAGTVAGSASASSPHPPIASRSAAAASHLVIIGPPVPRLLCCRRLNGQEAPGGRTAGHATHTGDAQRTHRHAHRELAGAW